MESDEDFKQRLGALPNTLAQKELLARHRFTYKSFGINLEAIPDNFDSRQKWPKCESIKDVRDQSRCGSCWAVSSAGAMSDRLCIDSNGTDQRRISATD